MPDNYLKSCSPKSRSPKSTPHDPNRKILEKRYIESIRFGEKTLELRPNNPKYRKWRVDDIITFNVKNKSNYVRVRITKINYQMDINDVCSFFTLSDIYPDMTTEDETFDEFHKYYEEEDILGDSIIVFTIELC